jgi:hypothetical protein
VESNDILALAVKTYRFHRLVRIDAHTLQCETGGVAYVPIPPREGANYVGMLSVDLPETVKRGQVFTIVVRQVTSTVRRRAPLTHVSSAAASPAKERRILGSFQITIPVRAKEELLGREERLLSNLRWIERAIPADNRWFPVFGKYVQQIARRVDALGGDSRKVMASASGEWRKAYLQCRGLGLAAALLVAAFAVGIAALAGSILLVVMVPTVVLLTGVTRFWIKRCRPGICQLLKALIAGTGIGAIVLALLMIFRVSAPQLLATLVVGAAVAVAVVVVGWLRRCL